MLNLLKTDLKILFTRLEFKLILLISIFIVCGNFISMCIRFYGRDIIDVFQASDFFIGRNQSSIFNSIFYIFLFPLISAFSYSDVFLIEKSNNLYNYYITRTNKLKYFVSKIFVVLSSGMIVILIPLLISYLLSYIAAPIYNSIDFTNVPSDYYQPITDYIMFPNIYVNNPYLHNLIFIIIPCIFGMLFALLAFSISTLRKTNKLFILIIPTILMLIESFILGVLRLDNYSLVRYLYSGANIRGYSSNILFVNFFILLILTITILSFKLREKDTLW